MRDPKRIPRILRKLEKAWKEYPDMRLIQLLLYLGRDPEKTLDPFYLEDHHLEEILDNGKPQETKLKITESSLFHMMSHSDEARVTIDAFIRDVRPSTLREFLGSPGVWKMGVKDWYAVKLGDYRIVFRPLDHSTIELCQVMSEKSIEAFGKQMKKEEKRKKA